MRGRPPTPAIDRFWQKVKKLANGCWLWTAQLDKDGYGRFYWNYRKSGFAHQFAYEHFIGPRDPALTLDHKCRHTWCVNPEHLRQLPNVENVMIGEGVGALNARKTHCINGHEFTPENTYRDCHGFRGCKQCRALQSKESNKRNGAKNSQRYRERHRVYWSRSQNAYVKK